MIDKKKIAIYPGTFNPFHLANLNILEKAEAIFGKDNVFVCVGINPQKISEDIKKTISSYDQNSKNRIIENIRDTSVNQLKKQLTSKKIEGYVGFLTDYVFKKEKEGYDVTVIRGLRNGIDLEVEYNQTRIMWDQKPDMKIIYIPCDPLYNHISSTAYRELESVKEGSGFNYIDLNL